MPRIYNFSAGPATLPLDVLKDAQNELVDWDNLGVSILEVSHRSKEFTAVIEECENNLRELLEIPINYRVLFLQGGGAAQFSLAPLNLLGDKQSIDFIETGSWSKKAIEEAQRYAKTNVIFSGVDQGYINTPTISELSINEESAYLYFCANETVNGVEFFTDIDNSPIPVVADMSSNFLSRQIDVSKYGMIFAGAQKNVGPSGLTIVIVREDLLGRAHAYTPDVFNYQLQSEKGSMLNTPPTFAIYFMNLVLRKLLKEGGVSKIERANIRKAELLYHAIDSNPLYLNKVEGGARSTMNVPFTLTLEGLDERFIQEAKERNLVGLKGHRSVGGMRASIYNAMPLSGVEALVDFMREFELNVMS